MAIYEKKFTKPYPDGYKDKPDKTTPVTADILNMEDDTLVAVEDYLANIGTNLPDDVTINNSLIVGSGQGDGATGTHSMINGSNCLATGDNSHAEGYGTKASATCQHVQGKYNVEDTENKYAHIVGGGTSDTDRKNIHTLDWNGNAEFSGDVRTGNGASLDELNEQSGSMAENISTMQTELTSQGKAIGEIVDKKITKFYASSQGDTTLNDSDNGKMQDMMLYGKSEQKQYSGKNLLNATLQTTISNGITCTANGDGTYTLNGTATVNEDLIVTASLSVVNGKKYRLIGYPLNNNNGYLYLMNGTDSAADYGAGVTFTYVGDSTDTKVLHLVLRANKILDNVIVKPMLVDADTYPSATYDDFEPYVGGIPSPNPDYPQEIKSVVEPVVKVTGKNLLKPTLQTTTQNGVTCTNNGDGTYTLYGTATANAYFHVSAFTFNKGANYRLIGCPKGENVDTKYGLYVDQIWKKDNGQGVTFSTNQTLEEKIIIVVVSGNFINNLVFKPMIVDADTYPSVTYDDYEPYRDQSVTLTGITLNAIPVSSGGNVTIDGQQYISDYVDVERGKIVRMCKKIDFTTTDVYNYTNVLSNSREARYKYTSLGVKSLKDDIDVGYWCYLSSIRRYNKKTSTWGVDIAGIYQFGQGTDKDVLAIRVPVDRPASAYFKEIGGCIGLFVADTPTEESLSDELAEKLKALQTYYPQTNLFITSNQLDGYAIFNYPISLANGWNYVKQQIGDTRDYIYDMDLQMAQAYVNSEYAVALTELEV